MPRAKKAEETNISPEVNHETALDAAAVLPVEPETPVITSEVPETEAVPAATPEKTEETEQADTPAVPEEKNEKPVRKVKSEPEVTQEKSEPKTPSEKPEAKPSRKPKAKPAGILTIEADSEVPTAEEQEEVVWHEIRNAYRTRKPLTGMLGGIEKTEGGNTVAVVYYKEFRIVIPLSEMMINLSEGENNYGEMSIRQNKILGNMLGAEIDFVIKGIDSKTKSVIASRKEAMLRKRKLFYFDTDSNGMYRVHEGRIVEARVIAVAEKVVRVEVFGVECPILARDLSFDWLGDAHDYYNVGDQILIRITQVNRESIENLSIKADVKSVAGNTSADNLKKCRIQGKYAGKVTDIHKGVVFVRLSIGVNAVAHSCYDSRMPGKKDDVSFAVTHIDEERGVAVGIITRIIKQNL